MSPLHDFATIKEQIRARVDLVELVSQHTALTRRGRNFVGLCPFHQEKTPSFSVNPDAQFFKCFGCNAGGDVFTFVQLRESVDFGEALRLLADRAGIELNPTRGDGRNEKSVSRADLFKANDLAQRFFRKQLLDEKLGHSAREYVSRRAIDPEWAERFGLGLALPGDELLRAATEAGLQVSAVVEAGLFKIGEKGSLYGTFRDRLIFPIRDATGRCIGFGGRTLVESEIKYLNSPETPLFNKRKCLYGLDLARDAIVAAKEAIVVEGYTDCIACHQAGIANTVATLGTAATDDHMRLLRRYCDAVILVFDSDQAGQAAADRAMAVALKHNLSVKLAKVPGEKDPADYLQHFGAQGFRGLLNSAEDALGFSWNRVRKRFAEGDTSAANRREAVSSFVALVAELSQFGVLDAIQQGIIVNQLAALLSVSADRVRQLLLDRAKSGAGRAPAATGVASGPAISRDPEQSALHTLFAVVVANPDLYSRAAHEFSSARFGDEVSQRAARAFERLIEKNGEVSVRALLDEVETPAEAAWITDRGVQGSNLDNPEEVLEDALRRLRTLADRKEACGLAEELLREEKGESTADDDAERDRLERFGRQLAGNHGFASQRAIKESGGMGVV